MCMERCYIEAGNPGHKAKSVYSSYESRIVAASNKPENYTGACLCSLWQQLWSVNLVCWEERAASHFLLGSHNPIHIHWIRMTTGMALNTHWTLPTEFSEHSLLNSLLLEWRNLSSALLQNSLTTRTLILINMGFGASWQKQHFFMWLQGGCSLKPERNIFGFIFLFFTTAALLKYLHLLKSQALAYLCYKVIWQCPFAQSG